MKFNPTTGQLLPAGSTEASATEAAASDTNPSALSYNTATQNQSSTPTSAVAASPAPPAPEIRDTLMTDSVLDTVAVCFHRIFWTGFFNWFLAE